MSDHEELVIRIRAETQQLESGLKRVQGLVAQSSNGMSSSLAGVVAQAKALAPALSAGAIVAFGKSAFDAADRLNDLAMRTGVAASTFSALNVSLLQSGSNVDELSSSINRMNNMIGEAAKGSQEAIKAFDDIGLSVAKLQQLSPEEQFYEITRALGSIDNQSKFTNAGMDIFGRSFSNIGPLIRQANGDLREFVETQKASGNALTEEQLKRIDEFGDRWTAMVENMKLVILDSGILRYLELMAAGVDAIVNLPSHAAKAGRDIGYAMQGMAVYDESFGPPAPNSKGRASGSNNGLKTKESEAINKAKESLEQYNRELKRQHEYAQLSPSDAAARKAYYDTLDMAQKAGIKNAEELAQANAQVARSNEAMQDAMQESARFAAELKDQFAATAKSIMFDSKNAGDALSRLAQSLAEMIAQRYILGPLSDSIMGTPGGGGGLLGDLFGSFGFGGGGGGGNVQLPWLQGFADGGNPPVGVPSIVGERGPEIFVPKVAGTIIPNHAMGGERVVIQQSLYFSNGVQGAARAEIMNAIPYITEASKAAVFESIQRGGREAKIVGRRN
ncbi:MAG: hypothetical protein ACK502_00710 [Alphaproteobacteria bacterium]